MMWHSSPSKLEPSNESAGIKHKYTYHANS